MQLCNYKKDSRFLNSLIFSTSQNNCLMIKIVSRFAIKQRLFQTKNPIVSILSNVQEVYRKKSAQISTSKRLEAEQAYQQGDMKKALALFSQSVIRAPENGKNYNMLYFIQNLRLNSIEEKNDWCISVFENFNHSFMVC